MSAGHQTLQAANRASESRAPAARVSSPTTVAEQALAESPRVAEQQATLQRLVDTARVLAQGVVAQRMADSPRVRAQGVGLSRAVRAPGAPVAQRRSAASAAGARGVVQRVTAQVLPTGEADGVIGELVIAGRPPSAHTGTMGDHTTAFAAIRAGLETQLLGKKLREATVVIANLTHALYQLPGYQLRETLPKDEQERLDAALDRLHDEIAVFRQWRRQGAQRRKQALAEDQQVAMDEQGVDAFDDASEGHDDEVIESHDVEMNGSASSQPGAIGMEQEQPPIEELDDEEEDFDLPGSEHVGRIQSLIEYYLEARELIPLSTVNTKALNASLAGKGKGENPGALVGAQKGEAQDNDALIASILSLFDARAAAVVCITSDEATLAKVAPGVPPHLSDDERLQMIVRQHFATLESLYPAAMQQLWTAQLYGTLWDRLKQSAYDAAQGKAAVSSAQGVKPSRARYVAVNIAVDDQGVIQVANVEGRPKSPFSGTMGAHTSAFVVYRDLIWSTLVGQTLSQGAAAMVGLMQQARADLVEGMKHFPADSKQLTAVNDALQNFDQSAGQLAYFDGSTDPEDPMSDWDQVLELQDAVAHFLDLLNATPGATLDTADVNGKREGAHRATLLSDDAAPDARRRAILGLVDLGGFDADYLQNAQTNADEDPDREEALEHYRELNADAEEAHQQAQHGVQAQAHTATEAAAIHLMRHHLRMVQAAYPGALDGTGLDPAGNDAAMLQLYAQSIEYRGADAEAYKDVEVADEDD